ncbi:MAG: carboxymuconolactone decarboxylase family protein, partial [Vicinamibacteria bacterium]
PCARALRTALDSAWNSPILSRRSKALAFLVIARAVGCRASEEESAKLAVSEGFKEGDVQEVLSHLGSPALDPREAAIVPFARETVRYQPAQIQGRARALRAVLKEDEFLELVGVVALANAVARLGVLFELA